MKRTKTRKGQFFSCNTEKEKGRGVGINEDFMAKKYFPFGINILFAAALFSRFSHFLFFVLRIKSISGIKTEYTTE